MALGLCQTTTFRTHGLILGEIDGQPAGWLSVWGRVPRLHPTAITQGGGIYVTGTEWSVGGILRGNSAADGGGIFSAAGSIAKVNGTIVNNHASGDGDGIYVDDAGGESSVSITHTSFFANHADGHGGGLFNRETALPVSDSVITANWADTGGGIYDDTSYGASAALAKAPVTRNRGGNCRPSGCTG
jgi:hypothetical protein